MGEWTSYRYSFWDANKKCKARLEQEAAGGKKASGDSSTIGNRDARAAASGSGHHHDRSVEWEQSLRLLREHLESNDDQYPTSGTTYASQTTCAGPPVPLPDCEHPAAARAPASRRPALAARCPCRLLPAARCRCVCG